jgi:RHS repeat-associated protein
MMRKFPSLLVFSIVFLFFGVFASSVSAQVYYYHNDHLGSLVAITNEVGDVVWKANYEPFGGISNEQKVVDNERKYNAKELDSETGLYYYGARYYDPETGRFITADTIRGSLANPQSLNLYVYALNNPLRYVDPVGQTAVMSLPQSSASELFGVSEERKKRWWWRAIDWYTRPDPSQVLGLVVPISMAYAQSEAGPLARGLSKLFGRGRSFFRSKFLKTTYTSSLGHQTLVIDPQSKHLQKAVGGGQ